MGAQASLKDPPRVVLDTNVVLSAILFEWGRLSWLRVAWQTGEVRPLVSRETVTELVRVLAYPKFRLSQAERAEALADYLPYAEAVRVPAVAPRMPLCRDPFDLPFLLLAKAGKADALVTGDADLLALAPRFDCPILTPEAFRKRLRAQQGGRGG
jgi:putative PIN family toxin of toxin-antitoxin system